MGSRAPLPTPACLFCAIPTPPCLGHPNPNPAPCLQHQYTTSWRFHLNIHIWRAPSFSNKTLNFLYCLLISTNKTLTLLIVMHRGADEVFFENSPNICLYCELKISFLIVCLGFRELWVFGIQKRKAINFAGGAICQDLWWRYDRGGFPYIYIQSI